VDDAIITVENILRRLREFEAAKAAGAPAAGDGVFQVVLRATLEVRNSVVYATFVVAMVFVPVLTMSGLQGRFFAPLGAAFILANLASLVVALTVTPALCLALLSRNRPHAEPFYLKALKSWHRAALARVNHRPKLIIAASLILFGGSLASLHFMGSGFMPDFREGHFVVGVTMAPGTSLPEMKRLGARISAELQKISAIHTVSEQIGRAEGGEDTWGTHRGEMHVELFPTAGEDQGKVQDAIRDALAKFPGIQTEVLTFLGDRIGETISGETAQVVVNIFGDDLDVLDQKRRSLVPAASAAGRNFTEQEIAS